MTGLELAVGVTVRWLLPALVVSPVLLFVPTPHGQTGWILLHLGTVVTFGLLLAMRLAVGLEAPWFEGLRPSRSLLASAASIVALATGAVALVTIASTAALRLAPSMQFLQLLSALDIAWASGATAVGMRLATSRIGGWSAGGLVVAVCLGSVATYLIRVGYEPDGGWLIDASGMWRYILPFDMAAAVMALTTLGIGVRRQASQPIAQPSLQS